jgi:hypothetical protein
MVCSASSAERCNHLTFSTKAWYAAFLLSKNSIIGRNFSSGPAVLQQKPGMQLFFFRKPSSAARKSPGPGRLCLIDIACSRPLVRMSQHTLGQSCRRTGRNHVNELVDMKASGQHEEQASASIIRGVGAPSSAGSFCGAQQAFVNLDRSACISLSSLRTASVSFRMRAAPACFGTTIL